MLRLARRGDRGDGRRRARCRSSTDRAGPDEQETLREEYAERFLTPWQAAERGFVDAVIDPDDTRAVVADALRTLETSREYLPGRKHTVGPL